MSPPAERFYRELFGWEYGSSSENERFTIITLNDKPIGGIILEDKAERDLPTARWFSSVSVEALADGLVIRSADSRLMFERTS